MKKYVYLVLCFIVFSCTTDNDISTNQSIEGDLGLAPKSAKSSSNVNLIKAWTSYSFYRGYGTYNRRFTVAVANSGFENMVTIYHEKNDGSWREIPMQYVQNISDNREVWELDNTEFGTETLADQFVIKYEVNGQTYWDNNSGDNYQMSRQEGYFFAQPDLNVSVDKKFTNASYSSYEDKNVFSFLVDVKNLSPSKEVQVVFTTDGWKTINYTWLTYIKYWYNGYGKVIESPNNFDVERWRGAIRLDTSINEIEYAVVYKVNNQEYWDNNYGQNYTLSKSN